MNVRAADNALHIPVLLRTCIDLLAPALSRNKATLIDATLGMGGHTHALLREFPHLRVIGIDRDPQAIELASERLSEFSARFIAVNTTYDAVAEVAQEYGQNGKVEGILMDLGVSSLQLDDEKRGFSYSSDAPLDMRMNKTEGITAADILRDADTRELSRILREYGEEKFAAKIASRIVSQRAKEPITRTFQLADIVKESIPAPARRTGGNPSKRTFQALRIAVNNELGVLERAIPRAIDALALGGRIVVESYQSLEDRIVKREFAKGASSTTPAGLPVELAGHEPYLKLLTRGATKADEHEAAGNPRSTSVRLRAAERIRCAPQTKHSTTGLGSRRRESDDARFPDPHPCVYPHERSDAHINDSATPTITNRKRKDMTA